ncbi:MAG: hypothetical protein HC873_05025 [Leptolyngbyaceae cyanobacterium SL_1_1]|nr:hypothetical protein [Leptolyngbyaceae cyanobacterium SL_1_1]
MVVTELPSRQILGLNQRTYQRLKLTLQLSLKRQLLIAICDDMSLRDRLVMQLETDVVATPATAAANLEGWQEHQYSLQRLGFDPKQPHLPKQIVTCLKQLQPLPAASKRVSLQITGIEQLTRQSATVQRQFLRSLRQIELLLPALEHSLLLWLPWPWARLIQQSVPGFWACHTGLFEFVGDPTPVGLVTDFSTAKSLRPTTTPVSQPSAAASLTASHTRRLVQPSSQKLTLMPPPAVPARKLKVPQKTDPAAAKVLPPPASSAPDSQRPDPQPLNPRSQQPPSPQKYVSPAAPASRLSCRGLAAH